MFVIFLSNRLHPDGKGDVTPLRARVATIVASSLIDVPAATARDATIRAAGVRLADSAGAGAGASAPVLTGIDVLRADGFKALAGLRVGLLTNHTGRARDGAATIDLLAAAPGVKLVALFSPEHGIRGILDASVPSATDERTGLPIHSLYGATRRPTAEMLAGLDAIVIDLQDIGARFYTYMTTMAYVMQEAARAQDQGDRARPAESHRRRRRSKGPSLDESACGLHRLPAGHADPSRDDDGRAGEIVQRREEDRRGSDGRRR